MSDDIDKAYSKWLDIARDTDAYYAFKAGAQHQAAQSERLAEALEPFVQQYAHISDEELENVSGKFFFERMMNARTALKAYRGK